jgi:hypothetical protein
VKWLSLKDNQKWGRYQHSAACDIYDIHLLPQHN